MSVKLLTFCIRISSMLVSQRQADSCLHARVPAYTERVEMCIRDRCRSARCFIGWKSIRTFRRLYFASTTTTQVFLLANVSRVFSETRATRISESFTRSTKIGTKTSRLKMVSHRFRRVRQILNQLTRVISDTHPSRATAAGRANARPAFQFRICSS